LTNLCDNSVISRLARVFCDAYAVLWADLRFMWRNRLRTLVTSLVNPLLYLVAFGYGLGRGISFEGVSYLEFVIPGIIALTTMTTSFTGAASKLNVDRIFHKSFDELLMSPISLFSIVIGKGLIGVVRGLISSTAILLVGVAISSTALLNPAFVLLVVLSCLVFSFLGVFAALLAKSHQDLNTINALILLPMTFLSGTFFSLSHVSEGLEVVLYFLPLTHSSQLLRATALGQPFPWLSLIIFIGFGVAFFTGCMIALKKLSV